MFEDLNTSAVRETAVGCRSSLVWGGELSQILEELLHLISPGADTVYKENSWFGGCEV